MFTLFVIENKLILIVPFFIVLIKRLIPSPNSKLNKVRVPDSKKIAAILLESNIIELQRHLLTITIQNQVSLNFICEMPTSSA